MLPDTELLCDLRDGMALCDANGWHMVFLVQSVLVIALGLTNASIGLRYRLGWLATPLWLARRLSWATLAAASVPLLTGVGLREQVRAASYACYLQHVESGCTHSLVDRGREMASVLGWVGWTESILLVTCAMSLAMLYSTASPGRR
jgi:hypothetical protein